MNFNLLRQTWARLGTRTKFTIVAALAFIAGTFLSHTTPSEGRYLPLGASGTSILDSKTGTAWIMEGGGYHRAASFSFF